MRYSAQTTYRVPIVIRINYNVKARGTTIGTLLWLVFYSESVSHTDRIIRLV